MKINNGVGNFAISKKVTESKFENVEDQLRKNIETIEARNREIRYLQRTIVKIKGDSIPLHKIEQEVVLQYEDVNKISYGTSISINSITNEPDTIPCLMLNWNPAGQNIAEQQEKLGQWLQIRLDLDTLQVIRY